MDLQAAILKSFGRGIEFDSKLCMTYCWSVHLKQLKRRWLPKACATGALEPGVEIVIMSEENLRTCTLHLYALIICYLLV